MHAEKFTDASEKHMNDAFNDDLLHINCLTCESIAVCQIYNVAVDFYIKIRATLYNDSVWLHVKYY